MNSLSNTYKKGKEKEERKTCVNQTLAIKKQDENNIDEEVLAVVCYLKEKEKPEKQTNRPNINSLVVSLSLAKLFPNTNRSICLSKGIRFPRVKRQLRTNRK